MSAELDRLGTEIEECKDVMQSAGIMIDGFAQFVQDHKNDPAALTQFANDLSAKSDELKAKVVANTPAEPSASPKKKGR